MITIYKLNIEVETSPSFPVNDPTEKYLNVFIYSSSLRPAEKVEFPSKLW